MEKLASYFTQPSTYKGIAILLSVFGIGFPITLQEAFCQSVISLIGIWAVIRDEFKGVHDEKKIQEKI
jgi:uncharacterized membrane protein